MQQDYIEELKNNDFALLIEAGFIAVKQADEKASLQLFKAAQVLNPESTAPQIGLGFVALNKLDTEEATPIFESVVQKEPENYLAQTFLGICYLLTEGKRMEGKKIIQESAEKSSDQTIKNLGDISLSWAEKDILKEVKAPFFNNSQ
ncbi:MAG: SctF chaperone SctG [Candidatus Protochlamydia sp.]|nr:SctF chaperone SctG [Candidatus Protochlamydia sp.]